eukprot:1676893-Amphidinium_carterae.1
METLFSLASRAATPASITTPALIALARHSAIASWVLKGHVATHKRLPIVSNLYDTQIRIGFNAAPSHHPATRLPQPPGAST